MMSLRACWVRRQCEALLERIPGAEALGIVVSWCPWGDSQGWRISVRLAPRWVMAHDSRLGGWHHWPDGYSLGAGRSLRRAFRQARAQAEELRALLACPECGAPLSPTGAPWRVAPEAASRR